ncbi:MAG: histone deacetylase [Candidatus Thorarchaeota archaeon]|nr:MAG: histone deacetylase [Candidatus Thorarchaeota archaeon]
MATALVFHDTFTKHVMSSGHPECPERLQIAMESITSAGLLESGDAELIEATPADLSEIYRVHDRNYITSIRDMSRRGGGFFTLDTSVGRYTYQAALLAAGGGILAVDRVMNGTSKNAFVLCRPPGHHAEHNRAFGFCFINNIAVAARHLLAKGVQRVLIVDYDAHHGNGTQNAFYQDNRVMYVGLHQDGRTLFPGTGFVNEIGTGRGRGFTLNIPMYPGAGRKSYEVAFSDIIEPVAERYKPEFVLVSAGYDCHFGDPLTTLGLTLQDISEIDQRLIEIAEKHAQGRIVMFLEGGYNLDVVRNAARATLQSLMGQRPKLAREVSRESQTCIDVARETTEKLTELVKSVHL